MLKFQYATDGTPVTQLSDGSNKQVTLVCDVCGKEQETGWHNYIQYQRKRGWTGQTSCQRCAVKITAAGNKGKRNLATAARNTANRGARHPCWRGGVYVDSHGYVMRKDPGVAGNGWKAYRHEHKLVIELELGRRLNAGEVIHHKNGDKQDNQRVNLWLTDSKGHMEAHVSLQDIGFRLMRLGLIDFDEELGVYIMADRKLRELLEQPVEANQQPSLGSNTLEGSETRGASLIKDNKSSTSAGHAKA